MEAFPKLRWRQISHRGIGEIWWRIRVQLGVIRQVARKNPIR